MLGLKRWAAGWMKAKSVSEPLILAYHRVANLASDPQLLSVTPAHFTEHLEVLRRQYQTIPLRDLNNSLNRYVRRSRTVVVTFDDGYADNLYNAKSLLDRYDVPATVFISTAYIGGGREFWWDELARLLLQAGTLPETLSLTVNGRTYHWTLGEGARYSTVECERNRGWNVEMRRGLNARQRLYRCLCQLIRPLYAEDRQNVLDMLLAWAGAISAARPADRPLLHDEIASLGADGLVEIGSHTATHPVLSALPPKIQRKEIEESKACLEEILGHPVTSFAYPYGGKRDYLTSTVTLLRAANYTRACANFPNGLCKGIDPFQLPRILVRDCDGEAFGRLLHEWFGD